MEKVLSIVTVNTDGNKNISSNTGTMTHEKNPFRISDIKLPQYSTGHFYMLLYLRGGYLLLLVLHFHFTPGYKKITLEMVQNQSNNFI